MRPDKKTKIEITRGITSELIKIYCKDAEQAPVVLIGWTAHALVKVTAADVEVAFNLAPTITDPEAGEITLKQFSDEETSEMVAGPYLWDLVLEDPDGNRIGPIAAGSFVVRDLVTIEPQEEVAP